MNTLKKYLGIFYPLFVFFLINLCILSLSRLLLGLWQAERISAVDGWFRLFVQGVRIDIASLCWLFAFPILLTCFLAGNGFIGRITNGVVRLWLVLSSVFIIFMEIATP
ncbi:LTA synthase family protein, partial [Avibacterium avium]